MDDAAPLTMAELQRVDLRVGTVVEASEFPEARTPAYRLQVDLGAALGVRSSSAQITDLYTRQSLVGRRVICVVNLAPRQVGPMMSEVLVTGFARADGAIVLAGVDDLDAPNGARLL